MDDVAGKARIHQQPLPANARRIPIPAAAVGQWLADIDDIAELKVTLRALALLADEPRRRSVPPSIGLDDLLDDRFLAPVPLGIANGSVRMGVAAAVLRGTLAAVRDTGTIRVLLNDEDCRRYLQTAGVTVLNAADLAERAGGEAPQAPPMQPQTREARANIFALYEEHIGTYGHTVAEQLRAAEEEYPAAWIAEAFQIASDNGASRWSYVLGILRRWIREGHHEHGELGHDTTADSRKRDLDDYRERYGRLPWEIDDTRDQ